MKAPVEGVCSSFEGAIKEKWVTNPTYFLPTMAYLLDNRLQALLQWPLQSSRSSMSEQVLELDRLVVKLGFLT